MNRGDNMNERFIIDILDENNWLIQDTVTGVDYNPIDGTTNVLKGLIRLLNKLSEENEELKSKNIGLQSELQIFKEDATHSNLKINKLTDENEQLQQRNDRQAKRLGELYELMAKKDWESLTEIIDDFCSCEEQLQRESGTYGDLE